MDGSFVCLQSCGVEPTNFASQEMRQLVFAAYRKPGGPQLDGTTTSPPTRRVESVPKSLHV